MKEAPLEYAAQALWYFTAHIRMVHSGDFGAARKALLFLGGFLRAMD